METLMPLAQEALLGLTQAQAQWKEHGMSVNRWYKALCQAPAQYFAKEALLLAWFEHYASNSALDLSPYHLHHDMAKPFCAYRDAEGALHYGPFHSVKSALMYEAIFGADRFSTLIANDMAFHAARKETIAQVWALPDSEHLYATAWAELYANAELFGGEQSDSFKIKQKRLLWALKNKPTAGALAEVSTCTAAAPSSQLTTRY